MRSRTLLTIVGAALFVAPVITTSAHFQSARAAGVEQAKPSGPASGQSTSKVIKLTPEQAQTMRTRLQTSHPNPGSQAATPPPVDRVKRSGVQVSLNIEGGKYWIDATWNGPVAVHLMLINRGRYPTSSLTINPVRVDDPRTLSDPRLFNCITVGSSCGGVVPGPLLDEPALAAGETRTVTFALPPSLNIVSATSCFSVDVLFRDEENQPYITMPQTVCPSRKVYFEPFGGPTPP